MHQCHVSQTACCRLEKATPVQGCEIEHGLISRDEFMQIEQHAGEVLPVGNIAGGLAAICFHSLLVQIFNQTVGFSLSRSTAEADLPGEMNSLGVHGPSFAQNSICQGV